MAAARRRRRWPWLLATVLVAYWALAVQAPPGPRTLTAFDPDRIADDEIAMWKAYYAKQKLQLFALLVRMLRAQYRYPWTRATRVAFYWARAAAVFGDAKGDYERVLPDLERGYAIARDWTGADFDVAAVARAELSWWVARRDAASGTGAHKVQVVGARMSELYARLYGVPKARVAEAAQLRADAADLRDRGGDRAAPGSDRNATVDWPAVSWLLHQSYRALHAAVAP
jgi:hypothetical protein